MRTSFLRINTSIQVQCVYRYKSHSWTNSLYIYSRQLVYCSVNRHQIFNSMHFVVTRESAGVTCYNLHTILPFSYYKPAVLLTYVFVLWSFETSYFINFIDVTHTRVTELFTVKFMSNLCVILHTYIIRMQKEKNWFLSLFRNIVRMPI